VNTAHKYDDQVIIPTIAGQLELLSGTDLNKELAEHVFHEAPDIDLSIYDIFIVCLSGGKDSIAAYLRLLEAGVDKSKIELWHHKIDEENQPFMDWVFMENYTKAFAQAFDTPLYFSWLEGGFLGEMLKENSYSKPHFVETPEGLIKLERDNNRSKTGTRLKFPQQAASLMTRWCSSALKIDVGRRALNNQERFDGKNICFITGERREESPNRSKYNQLEPHPCDRRSGKKARRVDWWKNVLHFTEEQVWELLEKYKVTPPVPYRLGWGRSSCMTCIFNSPKIWSTISTYYPERAQLIAGYEQKFDCTISRSKIDVVSLSNGIEPFDIQDMEALVQSKIESYYLPVFTDNWTVPPGAFNKEGCGSL